MAELVIHVWYLNCGSTLLQRHVFPGLKDIRHVPFLGNNEIYQALATRLGIDLARLGYPC